MRGVTLPWQLVEAHDPGPVYLPELSYAVERVWEKLVDGKIEASSRIAAGSRNEREGMVSGFVFMSRMAGVLYRRIRSGTLLSPGS